MLQLYGVLAFLLAMVLGGVLGEVQCEGDDLCFKDSLWYNEVGCQIWRGKFIVLHPHYCLLTRSIYSTNRISVSFNKWYLRVGVARG